ncbi:MAG: DUF3795 domain-containing protein [Bacteroidales bacterium]|nr:DUF3795 domain-containing protein [Bacteroidales bacterium]
MAETLKKHFTIGCCGIDCGLCPRFHTKGDSICPGCGGLNFKEKHPSCGFLTCCVAKKGLEVCSECNEYPCKRFDSEKGGYDSFVTHSKVFTNLDFIKHHGIDSFIDHQMRRITILNELISSFDDGRSKNFFCLSCALLPLDKLNEVFEYIETLDKSMELKEKNRRMKDKTQEIAASLNIELKLNKKK